MNKLPNSKRAQILTLLVEGNSLRGSARIMDVSLTTVKKLFADAGKAAMKFHDQTVRGVKCKRVQCDEMWSYVYSRQKNTPVEKQGTGIGDVWLWVGMDADSKLIVSWYAGNRDADEALVFMKDLAMRIKGKVQLTTDGYMGYRDAVDTAFRLNVDYAQLIKIYSNKKGEETEDNESKKHYRYKGNRKEIRSGEPNETFISTSYIERQNLTVRTNVRRFTRKTNAFSKKYLNHCYAVALHYFHYNFVRLHKSLNMTLAMSAGLTKRFMSMTDLVELID